MSLLLPQAALRVCVEITFLLENMLVVTVCFRLMLWRRRPGCVTLEVIQHLHLALVSSVLQDSDDLSRQKNCDSFVLLNSSSCETTFKQCEFCSSACQCMAAFHNAKITDSISNELAQRLGMWTKRPHDGTWASCSLPRLGWTNRSRTEGWHWMLQRGFRGLGELQGGKALKLSFAEQEN